MMLKLWNSHCLWMMCLSARNRMHAGRSHDPVLTHEWNGAGITVKTQFCLLKPWLHPPTVPLHSLMNITAMPTGHHKIHVAHPLAQSKIAGDCLQQTAAPLDSCAILPTFLRTMGLPGSKLDAAQEAVLWHLWTDPN